MLSYAATPIQQINSPILDKAGVRVLVKREDLNHPFVSGNKWWKLKYNLAAAKRLGLPVLTFGGAYSNHIFATAAAATELNIESVGIIRGEKILPFNHTLSFAEAKGMKLQFVSRELYRHKKEQVFIESLKQNYGNFYLIPEGGTNDYAIEGCKEFAASILNSIDFDSLILPVGTGGTIAGIISGINRGREIIGVSVLKNGDFLKNEITDLLENISPGVYGNWSMLTSYDHGGYAKVTKELLDFVAAMKTMQNLPLDNVYTGKLIWAALKEVERGRFPRGSTVLALHTGGLQAKYE